MPRIKIIKVPKKKLNAYQVGGEECLEGQRKDEFGNCVPDFNYQPTQQKIGTGSFNTASNSSASNTSFNPQPPSLQIPQTGFDIWSNPTDINGKNPNDINMPKQTIMDDKGRLTTKGTVDIGNPILKPYGYKYDKRDRRRNQWNAFKTGVSDTFNNLLDTGAMAVNFLENRQKQKAYNKWAAASNLPDNYMALNTSQDRGDYDINNGIFRPDQMGFKSKGMYTNPQYAQQNFVRYGGSLPYAAEGVSVPYVGDIFMPSTYIAAPVGAHPSLPASAPQSSNVSLSGDFENYADKAQTYINKVNPNTDITGDMLAAGAQHAYEKYGRVVPVELALAQLQQEGYLAKSKTPNKPQRTKNPFNVGNTDAGDIVDYTDKGLQQGVNTYFDLIAKSYLKNKTPEDLLNNFTNVAGNRYAGDKNYEVSLKKIIANINNTLLNDNSKNTAKMKVRIIGTPDQESQMAYGGQPPYSGQSNYGLYIGQRNLYKTMAKHPYEDVKNTVSEEPETPDNPHVLEAEDGEVIKTPNGTTKIIVGKKHYEGGEKLNKNQAPEGSFIFSDTAKMKIGGDILKNFGKPSTNKKYTPAELAKQYNTNVYRAILADPTTDNLQKNTAKRMLDAYERKLAELALVQEGKKGFPQGIPDIAKSFMQKVMGKNSSEEEGENEQQEQTAKYGGGLRKFQGAVGGSTVTSSPDLSFGMDKYYKDAQNQVTLSNTYPWYTPYNAPKTKAGTYSRTTGLPTFYNPTEANQYQDVDYWVQDAKSKGKNINNIGDLQHYIYSEINQNNPASVKEMWTKYGPTLKSNQMTEENFADKMAGARTAFLMGQRRNIPGGGGSDNIGGGGSKGGDSTTGTTPTDTSTTNITPGDFNPGKSNVPWDFLQQDINNERAAAMNLALMKKYHMQSRNIQPVLPEFIPQDWRGYAASLQSGANAAAQQLGTYQPGSAMASNLSFLSGQQMGDNLGKYISGVDEFNAKGATDIGLQRANMLNQFTQYNAGKRDYDRDYENIADSRYRANLAHGIDRFYAAKNQKLTNRANLYAQNISESPDYYYNPRNQRMTFNSKEAMYNFMNRNRGGYQNMDSDDEKKYQLAQKYKNAGWSDEAAMQMAGFGRGSQTRQPQYITYPNAPLKNRQVTYGAPNMATNPYIGGAYDYTSMYPGVTS